MKTLNKLKPLIETLKPLINILFDKNLKTFNKYIH